jgi:hypothetical protein
MNSRGALLEQYAIVFKPRFEAGAGAYRAYAGIGLPVILDEGKRYLR